MAFVGLEQLRTVTQADSAVVELGPDVSESIDRAPIDGLGDGAAITLSAEKAVAYQFRVGVVVAEVAVVEPGAAHDDIDAFARRLATLQEQQLRAALDGGAQS
jgi:hypothetical protein